MTQLRSRSCVVGITLWSLPAELEDQFESQWHGRLDQGDAWRPCFEKLEDAKAGDLRGLMLELGPLSPEQRQSAAKLCLASEGRAVAILGLDLQSKMSSLHPSWEGSSCLRTTSVKGVARAAGWVILSETDISPGHQMLVPDLAGWRKERFPGFPQENWVSVSPE